MTKKNETPKMFYTICGFLYESCDDASEITSSKSYAKPEDAYPDVVKIVNDTIKDYDDGFRKCPKRIKASQVHQWGYDLNTEKYHLKVLIQGHTLPKETSKVDGPVKVKCYGDVETFKTREEALEKYKEGVRCCEGSERDRYLTIVLQLEDGAMFASDEE